MVDYSQNIEDLSRMNRHRLDNFIDPNRDYQAYEGLFDGIQDIILDMSGTQFIEYKGEEYEVVPGELVLKGDDSGPRISKYSYIGPSDFVSTDSSNLVRTYIDEEYREDIPSDFLARTFSALDEVFEDKVKTNTDREDYDGKRKYSFRLSDGDLDKLADLLAE